MFAGVSLQRLPAPIQSVRHVSLHVVVHVQQSAKLLLQFVHVPTTLCRDRNDVVEFHETLRPKILANLDQMLCHSTSRAAHVTKQKNKSRKAPVILSFVTVNKPFLSPNQQCQSTERNISEEEPVNCIQLP